LRRLGGGFLPFDLRDGVLDEAPRGLLVDLRLARRRVLRVRDLPEVLPYPVEFCDYWVGFGVDALELEVR